MSLPLIDQSLFLALMAALQLLDAWTTYTALKLSGQNGVEVGEANPVARKLFNAFGTKQALWIIKLGLLAWIWWSPPDALAQWVLLPLYLVVVLNNLCIVRKLKKG